MTKKHSFEYVFNFFKEQNCELISTEYINVKTKLEYICVCGNKSSILFNNFQQGQKCYDCKGGGKSFRYKYDYVKKYFEENNCELLETEYINNITKMDYICECGNKSKTTFDTFKNNNTRCMKCSGSEKHTFQYVQETFWQANCELLSTEYKISSGHLDYICECGNKSKITFKSFLEGHRCKECGYEKSRNTGKTFKEYIFPSGEIRKIQGYENYVLDNLLEIYTEEQIITDRKNMPKIFYFLKQTRRYFPDIYIPHLNKIIEVKSTYTFEKEYIKNMMKSLETKKNFDYEIWIYDERNKEIVVF